MPDPLVSVIIPTYNRAHSLGQAIESVLKQRYSELEIIVIDDGSTDHTAALLAQKYPQVSYAWQSNRGPSAARNHGVRISSGEIIMFLDSDDTWLPGKVRRQVDLLQKAGSSVCCCVTNAILRGERGEHRLSFEVAEIFPRLPQGLWTNPSQVLASRFLFFNQVAAVRRDALLLCKGFDEQLTLLEDWDLALRLSELGSWVYTIEPFAVWNPNSNESLVTRASKDRISLRESALCVHKNALARAQGALNQSSMKLLDRKIKSTQHELLGLRLSRSRNPLKKVLGNGISLAERGSAALFKRSRHWPAMEVTALSHYPVRDFAAATA
ncbi:MAG: glycosyltransferase family 2 protein [Bacillota bacterium]|nr:glycosyltransferase family 2 protein [Bacillota bacterium]